MIRQANLILFFLFMACARPVWSITNLALHRSYTFSPKPNYPHCTDEGDRFQLTDGVLAESEWTRKSTVGWKEMFNLPEITIDLGGIKKFDEIRIHSIGGGFAGVKYLQGIIVFVSDDKLNYECAAIFRNNDKGRRFKIKKSIIFSLKNLDVEGHYIKIFIKTAGTFFFLDEIEIIQNAERNDNIKRVFPMSLDDIETIVSNLDSQGELAQKIERTIEAVKFNKQLFGQAFANKKIKELEAIEAKFYKINHTFISISKLKSLNKMVGIIRSEIYQKNYGKAYVCIPADPMNDLLDKEMNLVSSDIGEAINLNLWQAEFESAAINIINCSKETLKISALLSEVKGPAGIVVDKDKTFKIRRGIYVQKYNKGLSADALVLQNEDEFEIEPGEVTQLWLTVFNPNLSAGFYETSVIFNTHTFESKLLVELMFVMFFNLCSIKFNFDIGLNSCVCAYPELSNVTKNFFSEAMQELQVHRTNIFVAHESSIPFPRNFIGTRSVVDYSSFDHLIEISKYAREYLFYFNFNEKHRDHGRFGDWMSVNWKKKFSSWLLDWVKHLKEIGIGYDKFAMYPFDESLCDEFYELAVLIKSIEPKIRIFANSSGKSFSDFVRFKDVGDIWCFYEPDIAHYPVRVNAIGDWGKEFWIYDCDRPGNIQNPYIYYRLLSWRAFHRGQTGAGYWVYVDLRDSNKWDDTMRAVGNYGVVYAGSHSPVDTRGENIIPSRRWELWREGVEDYEYLWRLQQTINRIQKINPQKAFRAQEILDHQVEKVLRNPDNHKVLSETRGLLTEEIVKLSVIKN